MTDQPVVRSLLLLAILVFSILLTPACSGGTTAPGSSNKPRVNAVEFDAAEARENQELTLQAIVSQAEPTSWEWDLGPAGEILGSSQSASVVVRLAKPGRHTPRVRGCGAFGCSPWFEFELRVQPPPIEFQRTPIRAAERYELRAELSTPVVLPDGTIGVPFARSRFGTSVTGIAFSLNADPQGEADWTLVEFDTPSIRIVSQGFVQEGRLGFMAASEGDWWLLLATVASPRSQADFELLPLPTEIATVTEVYGWDATDTPQGLTMLARRNGRIWVFWPTVFPPASADDWELRRLPFPHNIKPTLLLPGGDHLALIVSVGITPAWTCAIAGSLRPAVDDPWQRHALPEPTAALWDAHQVGDRIAVLVAAEPTLISGFPVHLLSSRVPVPTMTSDWELSEVRPRLLSDDRVRFVEWEGGGALIERIPFGFGGGGVLFQEGWGFYRPLTDSPLPLVDWYTELVEIEGRSIRTTGGLRIVPAASGTRWIIPSVPSVIADKHIPRTPDPGLFLEVALVPE